MGCDGCSSWFKGLSRTRHNDRCRERFRELMREDAKLKNAQARKEEFLEKMEEKRSRKFEKENKKIAKFIEKEDLKRKGRKSCGQSSCRLGSFS